MGMENLPGFNMKILMFLFVFSSLLMFHGIEGKALFPWPESSCICFAVYDPVCGVDGKTYSNRCNATCRKTQVKCKGRCPCKPNLDCVCPAVFDPVVELMGKLTPTAVRQCATTQ